MRYYLGPQLPNFSAGETNQLKRSIDFIGVNHYSTLYAKDCIYSNCESGGHAIEGFVFTTGERNGVLIGEPTANPRFYVVPTGMEKIIEYFKRRYDNMPMFVTENGMSQISTPNEDVNELLNDYKRIEFHKSYLSSLARAIKDGANVRGYFAWSFMDNFEWQCGYSFRFGLHYVDYTTLKRTPKLSVSWFRNFLMENITYMNQEGISRNHHPNKKFKNRKYIDVE
ncbi:hypothetical protein Syun_008336 [Stephania yunnanensis]|uniref:Beta-glucosidase n=1 Tax=Stephania yunnanensis TaxID=152371 RepID=A0AAP0KCL5_9MAGN